MPEQLAYSVEEAAEMLSIRRTKMYELVRRGEIATQTIGRRRIVPRESLVNFLAANASQAS